MFNFKKKKVNNEKEIERGYQIVHENGITRTIGLPEKFGILNMEFKNEFIVADNIAEEILINSVNYAKSEGLEFKSPSVYVIDGHGNYTWYVVTKNKDEFVYRIIVPDVNNKAPWHAGCDLKFKTQLTDIDFKNNAEYKIYLNQKEVK